MSKYRPERDWPRLVPLNKTTVSIHEKKIGQIFGVLGDISDLGASIIVDAHIESNTLVLLRIGFRNLPDSFVTEAQVIWTRQEPGSTSTFTHGVIFCLTEEAQRSQLRTILDSKDFKLAHSADSASLGPGALDNMMVDLTEDLDKLGSKCHEKIGRRE